MPDKTITSVCKIVDVLQAFPLPPVMSVNTDYERRLIQWWAAQGLPLLIAERIKLRAKG
jgi:hypothetical protein